MLLCVCIHEFGHLLAIFLSGISIEKIVFSAVGAEIQLRQSSASRWSYAWIMAAGPLCSLIGAAIFANYGLWICSGISFFLGIFNSLPILPLDGGRFLQALCPDSFLPVLDILSFAGAVLLLGSGIFFLLHTQNNFSLLLIGLFLLHNQKRIFPCKIYKKAV